jgi:ATP dependent DNA ligase domain
MVRQYEYQPCIPTRGTKVPAGPDWLHEIKHDGYRLIVVRDGARVRLFTRNGHDWTGRYPLIVEAALRNRQTSFVIDGEAVLLGVDGVSDFNALHSRRHDDEVQLYAFDIRPLALRKTNLARLLARRPVARLDQSEKPKSSRDEPGGGFIRVNLRPPLQTSPAKWNIRRGDTGGKAMRVLAATLTLLVSSAASAQECKTCSMADACIKTYLKAASEAQTATKQAIRDWKENLDKKASAELSSRGTAALQNAMESQVRSELERLNECLAKIR